MAKITPYFQALNKIRPFVFRVFTPSGSGTGFQISYSKKNEFCGIATAYHVISHEDEWEEPIRLEHFQSGKSLVLKHTQRVIFTYPDKDLAFILFYKKDLPIETKSLSLIDKGKTLKQGVETGWCGFPAVAPGELCFFAGHISCCLNQQDSYLVDGVAINGVSGGPAFYIASSGEPKVCGVISAYRANRATGEALPGVSVVRAVKQYHSTLKSLESLEEAEETTEEEIKGEDEKKPKKKGAKKKTNAKKKVAKRATAQRKRKT